MLIRVDRGWAGAGPASTSPSVCVHFLFLISLLFPMCWRYKVGKPYSALFLPYSMCNTNSESSCCCSSKKWFKGNYLTPFCPEPDLGKKVDTSEYWQLCYCCWQLEFLLKKRASHLTNLVTYCGWCERNTSSIKPGKVKKVVFLIDCS